MKFVIIKGIFFSDTHFMTEMFEESNFQEENVKKIAIFKAKFSKNGEFQGIFFFALFTSFSLQRIFFANIFFVCKESLLAIQYSSYAIAMP